jgi:hypothetical protein
MHVRAKPTAAAPAPSHWRDRPAGGVPKGVIVRRLWVPIAVAVLAVALVAPSAAAGPSSGAKHVVSWVYNPATGHYYTQLSGTQWPVAEAQAVALGGHLVTINDATEEAWLEATFPDRMLLIGLNDIDQEGTFVWSSGQAVTYENWTTGQPDNWLDVGGEDWVVMNGEFLDEGKWDDVDGGWFGSVVEVDSRPAPVAPPMNSFVGSFDMVTWDGTVVAHVVADFQEPTARGKVPGSIVIDWMTGSDVRRSQATLSNAFFNSWNPEDVPDEGLEYDAFAQGVMCDVSGPQTGSCQPFAMGFVQTVDPAYPNHVGFSVPGSNVCCDGAWYDVGRGVFRLNYFRDTP